MRNTYHLTFARRRRAASRRVEGLDIGGMGGWTRVAAEIMRFAPVLNIAAHDIYI